MIEPEVFEHSTRDTAAESTSTENQEAKKELERKLEEARKEEERATGQVVDIPKPPVEMRPDDAKFLSEHDSKVEKESKARALSSTAKPAARHPPALAPGAPIDPSLDLPPPQPAPAPAPARPRNEQPVSPKTPGVLAMRSPAPPATAGHDRSRQSRLGLPDGEQATEPGGLGVRRGKPFVIPPGKPAASEPQIGSDSPTASGNGAESSGPEGGETTLGPEGLMPTNESISRAIAGSGSSDYLRDIDEGEETLLNTKRFKYAPFFGRIKRSVAQNWNPGAAYGLRDPTGQIYGHKNRLTILKVTLRPDGSLRDVLLEKPCGVDFLDDEAIKAFRQAQPFPNPPEGLVDKESNLITFRFGFYFEIAEGPTFKVFRYSN
ncbi:MAG: energy transducer TonB [Pseudomonadota bacterium]